MNTTASNRRLRTLLTGIADGTLIPRPDFQRRLVWTNKDKLTFLETVLLRLPFPEIYIAAGEVNVETGVGNELLVDGQQRISTLYQYFTGSTDLRVGRALKSYSELDLDEKGAFLEYSVVVRDLGSMPIDKIKEIFQRINATAYSLNAMEIHNARFNGEFKQAAEEVASDAFWQQHRVFSQNEVHRMDDLRFVLTWMITAMAGYFNRDTELEKYLRTYNDEFDTRNDLVRELEETLATVNGLGLPERGRAWKRSDLFSLLVEVHRARFKLGMELDLLGVGERLRGFYAAVDRAADEGVEGVSVSLDVAAYARAALQATNDRSSRVTRGTILARVLVGSDVLLAPTSGSEAAKAISSLE